MGVGRERDGGYLVGAMAASTGSRSTGLIADTIRFRTDGVMESAKFLRDGDRLYVLHRGVTIAVRDLTLAAPETAAASGGDGKVRAAMNGRVVAVLVKPGDQVAAGQPVMTLEAMKMEHVHTAPVSPAGVARSTSPRASRYDGEDRGGDRGGANVVPARSASRDP